MASRSEQRNLERARALLPPGAQVSECLGVAVGPNPDLIVVALLCGLLVIAVAFAVAFDRSMPVPFLLVISLVVGPLAIRAKGLVVSDVGVSFTEWDRFRREPSRLLRTTEVAAPVIGKATLRRIPVTVAGEDVWMTRGQLDRLTAAFDEHDGKPS